MPAIPGFIDLSKWRLADKKPSKEFKSWNGLTPGYAQWVERVHDHASLVNPHWRRLLDVVKVQKEPITWSRILDSRTAIDGLVPEELAALASDLYSFLGSVMTDDVHPRRESLAGGEQSNGFELWRMLCTEHAGGAHQCRLHGVRSFHSFPPCKDLKK